LLRHDCYRLPLGIAKLPLLIQNAITIIENENVHTIAFECTIAARSNKIV